MLAPVDFTRKVPGSELFWDADFTDIFMVLINNSRQIQEQNYVIEPL